MLRRLLDRAPAGYRPGATLEQVRRNLGLAALAGATPGQGAFETAQGLPVEVAERVESQWLMHLVMTEFSVRAPASQQCELPLQLRHSGALRRTGVVCVGAGSKTGWGAEVKRALEQDQALRTLLMPLDFKRLQLQARQGEWRITLEHMGASEVVNRLPAFRRYVRLDDVQRPLLLAALAGLQRCLAAV